MGHSTDPQKLRTKAQVKMFESQFEGELNIHGRKKEGGSWVCDGRAMGIGGRIRHKESQERVPEYQEIGAKYEGHGVIPRL